MGKITGFMEIAAEPEGRVAPALRVQNWREIHLPPDESEQQLQAGRCMDCGVPFCQSGMTIGRSASGCPLNNLIPEWNDLLWQGRYESALRRLLATNRFPEFTGRVCPALCEASCTCGMAAGRAVSIRANERLLVEKGYAEGWMSPAPPPVRTGKRVAVVGSGPSGLAAAEYLNKRGHRVTVFERSDRAGGLLEYGIPNMKLDKAVVARRIALMEAEGIGFELNADVGNNVPAGRLKSEYDAVVLCCGARTPRNITALGRDAAGIHFAVDYLTDATQALLENGRPEASPLSAAGRRVLVIGGGDTGNDCIATALRQGCTDVLALEMMEQPPAQRDAANPWPEWPRILKTDYGHEEYLARFGHDPRVFGATVKSFLKDSHGALCGAVVSRLRPEKGGDGRLHMVPTGEEFTAECTLALIAAGFTGCERTTARAFGLEVGERGTLPAERYATAAHGVFCCGDMRRGSSLVVWALREGRECAAAVDSFLMGYTNL